VKVSQLIGEIGRKRGQETENRFWRAFAYKKEVPFSQIYEPSWFYEIYQASAEKERKGIDVIIRTDIGKIFLNIKSSQRGKKEHQRRYGDWPIGVVVINHDDSDEKIRQKTFAASQILRQKCLQRR